jgi:hypothetical protein
MIATVERTRTVEGILRYGEMPEDEIEKFLTARDGFVEHMLIELHIERLREEFEQRSTALRALEVVSLEAMPLC